MKNQSIKPLIKHLLFNNFDEIKSRSLLNCHCLGLHSIMLLESPGKTIRLYISVPDNDMHLNLPENFYNNNMSLSFHAHHCNLTLHCIKGRFLNWQVKEATKGIEVTKYKYHSKIKEGQLTFEEIGKSYLTDNSYTWINEGESIHMEAKDMHTVGCEKGVISAWLVYEGIEDKNYESFCFSNTDVNKQDFSNLYKKPTYNEIIGLLELVDLL